MYSFRVTEANGERHINLSGIEEFLKTLERQFEEQSTELFVGKEIAKTIRENRRHLINTAGTAQLTKRFW